MRFFFQIATLHEKKHEREYQRVVQALHLSNAKFSCKNRIPDVHKIEIIYNPVLEERFRSKYSILARYIKDSGLMNMNWKGEFTREAMMRQHIFFNLYRSFPDHLNDPTGVSLVCHGLACTKNIASICTAGFFAKSTLDKYILNCSLQD
jgi:hypothetical protein